MTGIKLKSAMPVFLVIREMAVSITWGASFAPAEGDQIVPRADFAQLTGNLITWGASFAPLLRNLIARGALFGGVVC